MQIIIPMSGFGERFRKAGYLVPKPMIKISKKKMIAHVINMFPGEKNFIFICNKEHLSNKDYELRNYIKKICPSGKILSISPHKLGPVHAVLSVKKHLNLDSPTIVNYCDFSCIWDWKNFKKVCLKIKITGAIPCYKNFHPHSLGDTNYAYVKEKNFELIDIKEKEPFTDNKVEEFASSGTYYFESGKMMIESFSWLVKKNMHINGEFYVSLAYKYFLEKNKKILIYPIKYFMQWGTPEDLSEFINWYRIFEKLSDKSIFKVTNKLGLIIVLMAGIGKRFSDSGYLKPKALIEVSGQPMVINSVKNFPKSKAYHFVTLKKFMSLAFKRKISNFDTCASYSELLKKTQGQSESAYIGYKDNKKYKNKDLNPLTILPCDSSLIFNHENFFNLLNDSNTDIIVFGSKPHLTAIKKPLMFSWILNNADKIEKISVKETFENFVNHYIVTGAFTFKSGKIFEKVIDKQFKSGKKVNNEFYLDDAINIAISMGYKCKVFIVDHFISYGTPVELKIYEYWESCFHLWEEHPYNLRNNSFISEIKKNYIESKFKNYNLLTDMENIIKKRHYPYDFH